mmetsp:Transcript_16944/g.28383  ORF Transcript_16944/g.28383 Transcript_16944/m.28383 type:complete len:148 (-) Transcript_16944:118-561(-)
MVDCFTEDQIAEFREAFSLFDQFDDGFIESSLMVTVMRSLGRTPTASNLQNIVNEVASDGRLDFIAFLTVIRRLPEDRIGNMEIRELFRAADPSNSGYVLLGQLIEIIRNVETNVSDDEIKEVLDEFNGYETSNQYHYEDIMTMLVS